jgi:hypothetical protein
MDKQKINIKKYVFVFVLTTLIFVIGLFLGSMITTRNLTKLDKMEQDIKVQTMAIELQYQLISENPCSVSNSTSISKELYLLSDRLDYMENTLGIDDLRVLSLKEYYSILEIRHWLMLKKINEKCNPRNNLILYFYSNKGECNNCEEQGYALTYIRKKYPNVMVYTFDINSENVAVETIKDIYIKSEDLPVLIINDKVYYGFKDSGQIESLLLKPE